MKRLRTQVLSAYSGYQVHEALQRIHPQKQDSESDHNTETMSPHFSRPPGRNIQLYSTGNWLRKQQTKRSRRIEEQQSTSGAGKAKKCRRHSRRPGLGTHGRPGPNMGHTHCHWTSTPTLQRHPSSRGGCHIALSKNPEPGVRPICISDVIPKLVANGLLVCCTSLSPVLFKTHIFSLAQTSKMGQHKCFALLVVFSNARQNVLTMPP